MLAFRNNADQTTRIRPASLSPSRLLLAVLMLGSGLVVAHCGGGDDDDDNGVRPGSNPCDTVYQGKCGATCATDDACPTGLFCGNGACTAQCSSEGGCASGQSCSTKGRCVGGGTGGNGIGVGGSGPGGSIGVGGQGGSGGQCAGVTVQFTPIIPTIVLLVDQSTSMTDSALDPDDPKSANRWDALKEALLDDNGVLKSLQSKVRFGLTTYSWTGDTDIACPQTPVSVLPKLDNYDAISEKYLGAGTVGNTPTGESITKIHNEILKNFAEPGPKFILLATDGNPDMCSDPDSNDEEPPKTLSVEAISTAFADNIGTYVIGVSKNSVDRNHLRQLALAGQGRPITDTDELFFEVGTQAQLAAAFSSIVTGARSCSFDLDATITADAAPKGSVTIDGQIINLEPTNGWQLTDSDTITFFGTACDQIKAGATNVQASFPCNTGGVTPIPR